MEPLSITTILTILTAIVAAVFAWMRHSGSVAEREFARRNLKHVKMENFIKANLSSQKLEVTKNETIKREGPVWGFSMLGKYTIMVADPELVQQVLSNQFTNFTNRREFPAINSFMENSLFTVPDEKWKRLRSIVTPAFSVSKLRQMKTCMDGTVHTMITNLEKEIKKSPIQNVKALFDCFTIDTIIQTAFGLKVDSLNDPSNPIIVHGRKLFKEKPPLIDMLKMVLVMTVPALQKRIRIESLENQTKFFEDLAIGLVAQKRVEYAKGKSFEKASSFIEFILEAEAENKRLEEGGDKAADDAEKKPRKYMSTEEIVAQCATFFIAGFDTTAATLSLSAYQLAKHPEIQEKLHQKISTSIDKFQAECPENRDDIYSLVTYDRLQSKEFEYLEGVINEALRLDPPVIFLERTATADTELANEDRSKIIKVKAGDVIHMPTWSLHRDPVQWKDPEAFNPERFIGENATFHKYAYLPFGLGPRKCVAQQMAIIEAKLALLHIVRDFRFEVCPAKTEAQLEHVNQFDFNALKEVHLRVVRRRD